MKPVILLAVIVLASACVAQQEEIKELRIAGHGDQVYTFSNDIRAALKVFSNNETAIKGLFASTDRVYLVFNGSSQQDNAYFTVIATNIAAKIPPYFAYEGRIFVFEPYYFEGDKWHNKNGVETEKPPAENVLWLLGPDTGAKETSVTIDNKTVYLQGTDYKGLTLAADRLVLIVFGYDPRQPVSG